MQLDVINARLTKLMGERAELQEYTKLNAERRCLEFLILTGDNTGAAKELAEVRAAVGLVGAGFGGCTTWPFTSMCGLRALPLYLHTCVLASISPAAC